MYKLIVTDMDGTFLNSFGEISHKNLEAVKKAISMGVEFAIVTGRPYISVKRLIHKNGLTCDVIGCNGAQVTDEKGNLVRAHYIEGESLKKIVEMAEESDVYYQLYDDSFIYTKSRLQLLRMLKNYTGKSIRKQITLGRIIGGIKRLFFLEVRLVPNLKSFALEKGRRFYKVQIASPKQEELNALREGLKNIPGIDITSSNYFNIELGPKGVTKGTALAELAEIRGIKREEIMAFGDNYNDIPMLEYAGMGVAMENAVSAVKDVADYYTKSNDDDGVAYALDELLFKQKP